MIIININILGNLFYNIYEIFDKNKFLYYYVIITLFKFYKFI